MLAALGRAVTLAAQRQLRPADKRAVGLSSGHSPQEDAPAAPGAPATSEPAPAAPVPTVGLWQRVRAALLGHCSPPGFYGFG